jgi:putative glutamine amidotransferase
MTRPIIALTGRKGSFSRRSAEVYFYDVAHALERVGALGVLVPMTESGTILDEHVARFDGLILQGGDDVCPLLYGEDVSEDVTVDCERDRFEAALAKRFLAANKPLLGICRGMQLLNVIMGGTLSQNVSGSIAHMLDHHRNGCHVYAHRINIAPDGFFAGILGSSDGVPVNSFHRQGIRRLGEGLIVEAMAADGLPEAISLE